MIKHYIRNHFEPVGSFQRPAELRAAAEKFRKGLLDKTEYDTILDAYISEFVRQEIRIGASHYVDGEFRREYWHLDFIWGIDGVEEIEDPEAYRAFATENRVTALCGRVHCDRFKMLEDYLFLKQVSGNNPHVKMNVPSPLQFLVELSRSKKNRVLEFYNSWEELGNDLLEVYRTVIEDLYEVGCRCIQWDDCAWCYLCDPDWVEQNRQKTGMDAVQTAAWMVDLTNRMLSCVPEDVMTIEHICCGPFAREWTAFGGYTTMAPLVFPYLRFDAIHLKMDCGPLEVLKYVPDTTSVILGIVDAKSSRTENKEKLIEQIQEACKYHPKEMLALSTQCGFSSSGKAVTMTMEEQWEKVRLMNSISQDVWGLEKTLL